MENLGNCALAWENCRIWETYESLNGLDEQCISLSYAPRTRFISLKCIFLEWKGWIFILKFYFSDLEKEDSVVLDVSVFWGDISFAAGKIFLTTVSKAEFHFFARQFSHCLEMLSVLPFHPFPSDPPPSRKSQIYPPNSLTVLFSTGIFTQCPNVTKGLHSSVHL